MRKLLKSYQDTIEDICIFPNPKWISLGWLILHLTKYRSKIFASTFRAIQANCIKTQFVSIDQTLPQVELLSVTTSKDVITTRLSIASAVKHSQNGISRIVVVCPPQEMGHVSNSLQGLFTNYSLSVISECEYVNEDLYAQIRSDLGKRAGHAIQQLVKISYVSQSSAKGVLVLDSDTILLSPTIWLDCMGKQSIQLSWEKTESYYGHLERLHQRKFKRKFSTVTHHMLMQPELVREFCKTQNTSNVNEFLKRSYFLADKTLDSIFSMDYLFYGLNAIDKYPDRVELVRWCNVSRPRNYFEFERCSIEDLEHQLPFKSVSFHSWQS